MKTQNFVVTVTTRYFFKASNFKKARELAFLPAAIQGVQQETERSIVCEETGEEEPL